MLPSGAMARFNVVARLSDRRRHAGVVRRLAALRALRALRAPMATEVLEFDQVAALQVRIAGHQRLQRDVRMALTQFHLRAEHVMGRSRSDRRLGTPGSPSRRRRSQRIPVSRAIASLRNSSTGRLMQMPQPSGLLWTDKPRFLSFSTAALTGFPRGCEDGVFGRTDATTIRGTDSASHNRDQLN